MTIPHERGRIDANRWGLMLSMAGLGSAMAEYLDGRKPGISHQTIHNEVVYRHNVD